MGSEGQLGRYEVIRHLASGGMAQVLLARTRGVEGFERYCVIKKIHVERAHDQQVVKMFLDEARLAASLHHHNIVQVHDIGQDKGEYFFAMEYVHGEDLRAILTTAAKKQVTLPTEHVVTIICAAASALHYAHEHRGPDRAPLNIVHRDVSPANILVGYDGNVKVVDFGIAKASHRSAETQSGTLKGKISYMAPEQCMGQAVDRRSDVFALGIVLFELFTVRRLFKASSDFLTMSAIVAGNVTKPSAYRPDTPPELEEIILKALAHDPKDRYQTADELRLALDRYAKSAGLRTSTAGLADYMQELLGRRPEPWLVDEEDAEIQVLDVDFDGSASAPRPGEPLLPPGIPTPPPGSLLARAKRKIAPATGVEVTPMPPMKIPTPPAGAPAVTAGWGSDPKAQTNASGTPMAWTPEAENEARPPAWRSRRGLIAAAIAAPLVGIGIFTIARQGGTEPPAKVTPAAATAEPPKLAEPVTPAAPPPPVEPPKVEPVAQPAEPAPPPVVDPPKPKVSAPVKLAKKPPATKKPATTNKPATKATWDPNALFLKKKP